MLTQHTTFSRIRVVSIAFTFVQDIREGAIGSNGVKEDRFEEVSEVYPEDRHSYVTRRSASFQENIRT